MENDPKLVFFFFLGGGGGCGGIGSYSKHKIYFQANQQVNHFKRNYHSKKINKDHFQDSTMAEIFPMCICQHFLGWLKYSQIFEGHHETSPKQVYISGDLYGSPSLTLGAQA